MYVHFCSHLLRHMRGFKHHFLQKESVNTCSGNGTQLSVSASNDFDLMFFWAINHLGALVDVISVHLQQGHVCYTIDTERPTNKICSLNGGLSITFIIFQAKLFVRKFDEKLRLPGNGKVTSGCCCVSPF